ncbi:hypothetical protein MMC09_001267 [Bachmanniomyces sp. S44760]|nr:hypothetical protein [Bachmanniomyces sp. S44760]
MTTSIPPIARFPNTQPPSHRPPEFRKSQLHRQYTSLLRSTPLMLLFQHNNLKSIEWMSIRREINLALRKIDTEIERSSTGLQPPINTPIADGIKIQTIQSSIFASALPIAEYYDPSQLPGPETSHPTDPMTQSSTPFPLHPSTDHSSPTFTHALSRTAHDAVQSRKLENALSPLLSGPLALVTFPTISIPHLRTVLSILAHSPPNFPAPTRRANPGYYDLAVQSGLQKLLLLGARVEGRVFDTEGTRWVGGIEGGMDGLRARLVGMLQGFGAGLTGALEGQGRSLYFAMEGRRGMMEDEEAGGKKKEGGEGIVDRSE